MVANVNLMTPEETTIDLQKQYRKMSSVCVGVLSVFLGAILFLLAVISIIYGAGLYFVGHGIWCGILIILGGAFSITAGKNPTSCLVKSSLILNIVGSSFGVLSLILSIMGVVYPVSFWSSHPGYILPILMIAVSLLATIMNLASFAFGCKVLCYNRKNETVPSQNKPFSQLGIRWLGAFQILAGGGSISMGIANVVAAKDASDVGAGIWCGAVFLVHGIVAICAGKRNTKKLIRSNLTMGIVAAAFAFVQLGVTSNVISNDNDALLFKNFGGLDVKAKTMHARLIRDGLLVLLSLLAEFCGVWAAILSCRGTCFCCSTNANAERYVGPALGSRAAGLFQFAIGLGSLGSASVAIAISAGYSYVGHGIWCGLTFVMAGLFGFLSGTYKTKPYVVASLVLSIVAAPFALVQMTVSAAAIAYENWCSLQYKNYLCQFDFPFISSPPLATHLAVNAILIALAVLEFVFLLWNAIIGCKLCCGKKELTTPPSIPQIYMTDQSQTQENVTAAIDPTTMNSTKAYIYQNGQLTSITVLLAPEPSLDVPDSLTDIAKVVPQNSSPPPEYHVFEDNPPYSINMEGQDNDKLQLTQYEEKNVSDT